MTPILMLAALFSTLSHADGRACVRCPPTMAQMQASGRTYALPRLEGPAANPGYSAADNLASAIATFNTRTHLYSECLKRRGLTGDAEAVSQAAEQIVADARKGIFQQPLPANMTVPACTFP